MKTVYQSKKPDNSVSNPHQKCETDTRIHIRQGHSPNGKRTLSSAARSKVFGRVEFLISHPAVLYSSKGKKRKAQSACLSSRYYH